MGGKLKINYFFFICDNMMDIRIKTLMGDSLNIPKKISVKEPTYYKYVREKIDKIIINNSYSKIDYDLLANGVIMKDHMIVKNSDITLVPKLATGYKMTMNERKMYIPVEKVKIRLLDKVERIEYPNVLLKRRDIYTDEKEERKVERMKKENIRTRKILDSLKRKREMKIRRRELRKNIKGFKRRKDNYCGFKWGFLL